MRTERIKLHPRQPDPAAIRRAGSVIAEGGLVAFPTETVYGLGGDAFREDAAARIYAAKGRPSDNPLIVHIADISDLVRLSDDIPEKAYVLAEAFWPGPLTMILPKSAAVPDATTGGLGTVAVRMPDHPVALALIRESGCLIAAPSANTSGRPSPTSAEHVMEDLDGRIPMVLDAGTVGIGIESTILDLTEEHPVVLRPGYLTPAALSEVLGGEVTLDPGILSADADVRPRAPGMKYRHYAPRARMLIVEGEPEAVSAKINELSRREQEQGHRTAVIAAEETKDTYRTDIVLNIGTRADEAQIARRLYRLLRECDRQAVDVIYSESFAAPGIGQAVMNRLLKAAGHQLLRLSQEKGDFS